MIKEEELINKFLELEIKMVEQLNNTEMSVDFDADRKTIIASLKKYVSKVKSLEKLFDEYENLAKKIENLTGEEEKQVQATNAVVELREDSEELKTEIEKINGQVVVKKKKKKISQPVKEM